MGQRLCQIAFSVSDVRRSHQWYQDVLGFTPGGGTESFKGKLTEKVQGVVGARTTCWWLLDTQEQFQIELFQYYRPESRAKPADWRMCDIGYNLVGFYVPDFDAVVARAARVGSFPIGAVVGEEGARRVCIADPDGTLLEIMEDKIVASSPRLQERSADGLPTTTFITMSVADLNQTRDFFTLVLGMPEEKEFQLHHTAHEALWGLSGAHRDSALFWADGMLIEVVQYLDPIGRARPEDYRISDLGVLNFALGYRSFGDLLRTFKRVVNAGGRPNMPFPLTVYSWGVMYVNDPQNFSIELLFVRKFYDRAMGFVYHHVDTSVSHQVLIEAPVETVWRRLVDHENIGDWWCYKGRVVQQGEKDPAGVGTVRELSRFGERAIEEVVAFEPNRRLDYRLRSGAPMNYHYARVDLTPTADGRVWLDYNIRFIPKVWGIQWLMRLIVGGRMRRAVEKLKSLCEQTVELAVKPTPPKK